MWFCDRSSRVQHFLCDNQRHCIKWLIHCVQKYLCCAWRSTLLCTVFVYSVQLLTFFLFLRAITVHAELYCKTNKQRKKETRGGWRRLPTCTKRWYYRVHLYRFMKRESIWWSAPYCQTKLILGETVTSVKNHFTVSTAFLNLNSLSSVPVEKGRTSFVTVCCVLNKLKQSGESITTCYDISTYTVNSNARRTWKCGKLRENGFRLSHVNILCSEIRANPKSDPAMTDK